MERLDPEYWSKRVERLRERAPIYEGDEWDPQPGLSIEAQRERRWSSLVPEKFAGATFEGVNDEVRDRVMEWCVRPAGRNLVISGTVGTGKTHVACAAGRELHMAGREVQFVTVAWLWHKLRPPGDDDLLDAVCDVDVLLLDDLGMEKRSEWTTEQLWLIANQRWQENRPTVITTNLRWTDLRAAVGERVYDRLVNASSVRVTLVGESRRRMI